LFDRYGFGLWAIRQRQSPAIQGFAGIWPFRNPPEFELLFGIAEPLWGQGYAVEAAQAVLAYCASVIEMPVVRASTDVGNAASIRVLHKLGFTETQRATVDGLDTIFFERGSMPFKSKAQRRKFAQLLVEGKIKPETYEEWNRETGYRELPEAGSQEKTRQDTRQEKAMKVKLVRRGPFTTLLRRIRGKGGWTYVTIPKKLAPPITRAWARTPVRASLDGVEWDTSIWRAKSGEGFLPVPKRIRGLKEEGTRVSIAFSFEDDFA
jgi:hypothetical protein